MAIKKATIHDIAARTGLSITTVSRVLTGQAKQYRIGKKSQKLIIETSKELNYIPNQYAASLKSGKSNTIALIVPSLNNPFFATMASVINAEIRKFRYITVISDSDENVEIEKEELRHVVQQNIEGLIIVPCGNQSKHVKQLFDQGLPVICIDRYFEDLDIPYVSTDNYDGALMATNHLIENGHTNIACIQGVRESTPNRLRTKGFLDAMRNAGLASYSIVGDDFSTYTGYLETRLLMQHKERPTAIFTLSNTIAMGCMKALKEMKLRIPEDISLITFDDHPYLDYLSTPLSCIAQPVNEISKIAVKFLFTKVQEKKDSPNQILLKPEIKYKDSVRRIGSPILLK
jgi:LacI family transcriptional regulator